jgi:hypothetical protein
MAVHMALVAHSLILRMAIPMSLFLRKDITASPSQATRTLSRIMKKPSLLFSFTGHQRATTMARLTPRKVTSLSQLLRHLNPPILHLLPRIKNPLQRPLPPRRYPPMTQMYLSRQKTLFHRGLERNLPGQWLSQEQRDTRSWLGRGWVWLWFGVHLSDEPKLNFNVHDIFYVSNSNNLDDTQVRERWNYLYREEKSFITKRA